MSRTAIWKAVSKLKEEGYEIDSVPNRGYCLLTSPDAMTEAEIRSYLHTEKMGKSLVCFADTDSTNIQAKLLAEQNAPDGHWSAQISRRRVGGAGDVPGIPRRERPSI